MNKFLLIGVLGVLLPLCVTGYIVPDSEKYRPSLSGYESSGEHKPGKGAVNLEHLQAQIKGYVPSPEYKNLQNSEYISESLAENHLANNLRTYNAKIVPKNVVEQGVYRSLLVPAGKPNLQVIATQPLPPVHVKGPASPPVHVSSGPAAVVRSSPVIYKLAPSVIYQKEVINNIPTPVSLTPVYVKVYKSGKSVDTPVHYPSHHYSPGPSYVPEYVPSSPPSSDVPQPSYDVPAPQYGAVVPEYGIAPSHEDSYHSSPSHGY